MGVLAFALLLTFSRGAFVGFLLVNALFLAWKFNFKTLSLAIVALAICALFMPGYVYNRVLLGIGEGDLDAVSAGRIDGIWLPLLPEILVSPLWGQGLGSIMWSTPMETGNMLTVGHPHNAFLETLLDMGVIGLVLLLAYYLHVWRGFRALGSNAFLSPELRGFFQGATAGLLCHLVTGMAGSSLRPESEAAYLWMAIGMMYGLQARQPAQAREPAQARQPAQRAPPRPGAEPGGLMCIEREVQQGAAAAASRPEKMLSVCFVAPYAWPVFSRDPHIKVVGGAEVQQAILARLLAANGFRVSMVTLDYGQPDGVVIDGVTVYKAFTPDGGLPVLRFLHPRMSSMLRALRAANADVYYYRSTAMWAGVVAEFARRHGRRSIYAGASDRDFVPGTGGQIRYARDRWLFRHAHAHRRRHRGAEPAAAGGLPRHLRARRRSTSRAATSCRRTPPPPADTTATGAVGRHDPRAQAPRAAARAGAPAAAAALRHDRRAGPGSRLLRADPRASGGAAEPRVQGLPAAGRGRALVRPRARARPHLALRGHAERVPAGLGARRAHGGDASTSAHASTASRCIRISTTWMRFASHVEALFENQSAWEEASARCREYFERTHSPAEVLARYSSLLHGLAA